MSEMLSVDDARARLLASARPVAETETLAAEAAIGRVLAMDLVAGVTVPPWDNAAMDGYALRVEDWRAEAWLPVSQRIPAGGLPQPLPAGTAARIFTGAPIPEGADAVVMQEDTRTQEGAVCVLRAPRPGDHLRRAGEDIGSGQTVLEAGVRLGPAQLGVVASVGVVHLAVRRRLRVAVFFPATSSSCRARRCRPGASIIPTGRPCSPSSGNLRWRCSTWARCRTGYRPSLRHWSAPAARPM